MVSYQFKPWECRGARRVACDFMEAPVSPHPPCTVAPTSPVCPSRPFFLSTTMSPSSLLPVPGPSNPPPSSPAATPPSTPTQPSVPLPAPSLFKPAPKESLLPRPKPKSTGVKARMKPKGKLANLDDPPPAKKVKVGKSLYATLAKYGIKKDPKPYVSATTFLLCYDLSSKFYHSLYILTIFNAINTTPTTIFVFH